MLNQVQLPHSYYWRELYIPQLTTGPSSAAFMPDGYGLVYSMAGSLWQQQIGADEAVELTHADAAYDYQPDVAPNGGGVVFSRYDGRSIELWWLDLESRREQPLTQNGGVNVEPRLSPDGRQLVCVSTAGTGHFDLKIADLTPAGLANERYLVAPRESAIDRYYYSTHDHAINPSWSPDGQRVWFVSNAEIPWGTGTICSIAVADAGQPDKSDCSNRHRLETSWAARPEIGPDGKRILFSNYHGGQWHQLWLTTTDDAAPLQLTYGEFDRRNARWSPDGKRIAYISNENGNTALLRAAGLRRRAHRGRGADPARPAPERGRDDHGDRRRGPPDRRARRRAGRRPPLACAARRLDACRRGLRPRRSIRASRIISTASRPAASNCRRARRRSRRRADSGACTPWARANSPPAESAAVTIPLADHDLPADFGRFLSADLHVHMNYGGHYRNTPERLLAQQEAEDLDVVHNLIVNKEERIPDIGYFRTDADPASGRRILLHAQEYHTSFWGHLGLLHLSDHYLLPDYTSYRHTALASPWPHNGEISDLAHAQGALVGYVHIADFPIDPPNEKTLSYQLPADVAQGKVDYLEVMGFSDHHITAGIWYRLLNLGFRVPAGAGTDAMANYASLRGPVGLVRVFLDTRGERTPAALRDALKEGRSFVSNGPLLGLTIDGRGPGGVLAAGGKRPVRVAMRSPVPVDHLELVQNGRVIREFKLDGRPEPLRLERRPDARERRLGRAARVQRKAATLGARPLSLRDDEPDLPRCAAAARARGRRVLRRLDEPRHRSRAKRAAAGTTTPSAPRPSST